ncbi:Hypothetical_protein [Hexamita inflata]|uniref:Hypothetical_protein n=1 Tax=Hexamita inflata TaxID=28002 RepID=A0AA86PMQ4_9EUKA|nr:Hypothetical protein HINF_LOCUS27593 [Hexamita inflata]
MNLQEFRDNPPTFEQLVRVAPNQQIISFISALDKVQIRRSALKNKTTENNSTFEQILQNADKSLELEFNELTTLLNVCIERINVLENDNKYLTDTIRKLVQVKENDSEREEKPEDKIDSEL